MKRRASETDGSTSSVIASQIQSSSEVSQYALPSAAALKRRVRRIRAKADEHMPENPKSLTELIMPVQYTTYSPALGISENFLMYDSGPGSE